MFFYITLGENKKLQEIVLFVYFEISYLSLFLILSYGKKYNSYYNPRVNYTEI